MLSLVEYKFFLLINIKMSTSVHSRLKAEFINSFILFRIREEQGSDRRGMGSAFHQLCQRYNGTLTPLPLRLLAIGNLYLFMHVLMSI